MTMFVIILVGLVCLLLKSAVVIVPQGFQYTLERFGRYVRTLRPGLHVIMPLVEVVAVRMLMKEVVLDVPRQDVITKDNAMVSVDGVIFYQIMDAPKAAYEVDQLEHAIMNLAMTTIRTVMGAMDLDELLSQRERINLELLKVIDDATNPWGTKVTRVEIKDIVPPKDLVDSMGRQMKAERDKRAQILEAQGSRQADILRAEGYKEAAVLRAQGEKASAVLLAEARERQGQAEAKATQMLSEAMKKGTVQAVNYFIAEKYVGALKDIAAAPNHKVIFMPLEAANVIGSLGGIAELAKETFSERKKTKPSLEK
ncbi:MAG: SPFH/Band 7/PHB domain protein [Alphaproteobacteria bacterium]|nr:MAG: SPFH/Band 7/PHB domain protein [Alphaproteobacteria bacterium]